ncbi:uncharacterized protein LOC142348255 [Convolutriloba macropyga]|uniref:uncharacterized protein LOC142348255 n=1 Tax=Convolutriloba macropyga TaxID=536237 RepID=UPI003F51D2E3
MMVSGATIRPHQPDAKEEPSPKARKLDAFPMPKCEKHPSVDCTFWCDECVVATCVHCVDVDHEKHSMHMLRHVIKEKLIDASNHVINLKDHASIVEDTKSQCDRELSFLNKSVLMAERRKARGEKTERFLKAFDPYLPALKSLVYGSNNAMRVNIGVKTMEILLKVFPKRDCDILELPSRMIFKSGHIATPNDYSLSVSGCGVKFQVNCYRNPLFFFMDNYLIYHFYFRFRCTSAKMWPVKAAIRIVTTQHDEEGETTELSQQEELDARDNSLVTNCHIENDLVFSGPSTEHKIKARAYSSKINYVIEIYPMN